MSVLLYFGGVKRPSVRFWASRTRSFKPWRRHLYNAEPRVISCFEGKCCYKAEKKRNNVRHRENAWQSFKTLRLLGTVVNTTVWYRRPPTNFRHEIMRVPKVLGPPHSNGQRLVRPLHSNRPRLLGPLHSNRQRRRSAVQDEQVRGLCSTFDCPHKYSPVKDFDTTDCEESGCNEHRYYPNRFVAI